MTPEEADELRLSLGRQLAKGSTLNEREAHEDDFERRLDAAVEAYLAGESVELARIESRWCLGCGYGGDGCVCGEVRS